jgi:hypothetical protein
MREKVDELFEMRRRVRIDTAEVRRTGASQQLFPEEFDPEFLLAGGDLLGYPACCSAAYVRDRTGDVNVEARAAQQAAEAPTAQNVPYAYFAQDFFPCRPTCVLASEFGSEYHKALLSTGTQLGKEYVSHLRANRKRVVEYPERIKEHQEKLRGT